MIVPTALVSRKRCDSIQGILEGDVAGCQQRWFLGSDATWRCGRFGWGRMCQQRWFLGSDATRRQGAAQARPAVPTALVSRKRCDHLTTAHPSPSSWCQQRWFLGSDATGTPPRRSSRRFRANSVGFSEAMRRGAPFVKQIELKPVPTALVSRKRCDCVAHDVEHAELVPTALVSRKRCDRARAVSFRPGGRANSVGFSEAMRLGDLPILNLKLFLCQQRWFLGSDATYQLGGFAFFVPVPTALVSRKRCDG